MVGPFNAGSLIALALAAGCIAAAVVLIVRPRNETATPTTLDPVPVGPVPVVPGADSPDSAAPAVLSTGRGAAVRRRRSIVAMIAIHRRRRSR